MGPTQEALNAVILSFEHRLEQAKAGRPDNEGEDCVACQWWWKESGQTYTSDCVVDCEDGSTRSCPCEPYCRQYCEWFDQLNDGKLSMEDFIVFLAHERGFVEELETGSSTSISEQ